MTDSVRITIPSAIGDVSLSVQGCSRELASMLRANWRLEGDAPARELVLAVRADGARAVRRLSDDSWQACGVCDYTALKVAVRGVMSDARIPGTVYVHGCAFQVGDGRRADGDSGVLLLGSSGAGKTTLVSMMARSRKFNFELVNDDWGPFAIDGKMAISTGEKLLHVKVASARALNPSFDASSPSIIPDAVSPGGRAFVPKGDLYEKTRESVRVRACVVLTRDSDRECGIREIDARQAVSVRERGSYSPYFGKVEEFMNGSLLLGEEGAREYHRGSLLSALSGLSIYEVNNVGGKGSLMGLMGSVLNGGGGL